MFSDDYNTLGYVIVTRPECPPLEDHVTPQPLPFSTTSGIYPILAYLTDRLKHFPLNPNQCIAKVVRVE